MNKKPTLILFDSLRSCPSLNHFTHGVDSSSWLGANLHLKQISCPLLTVISFNSSTKQGAFFETFLLLKGLARTFKRHLLCTSPKQLLNNALYSPESDSLHSSIIRLYLFSFISNLQCSSD